MEQQWRIKISERRRAQPDRDLVAQAVLVIAKQLRLSQEVAEEQADMEEAS